MLHKAILNVSQLIMGLIKALGSYDSDIRIIRISMTILQFGHLIIWGSQMASHYEAIVDLRSLAMAYVSLCDRQCVLRYNFPQKPLQGFF